jgi:hypothetical protein
VRRTVRRLGVIGMARSLVVVGGEWCGWLGSARERSLPEQ